MKSYAAKKILMLIPVLLGVSLIVFFIIHAIPGNPAQVILGQQATKESIEMLTKELGLDQPLYVQYFTYMKNLLQGDLGTSLRTKASITGEIWPYLAATIELSIAAMIIAVFIGINAGIISAWLQNTWFDYSSMIVALIGISIPVFWLGLLGQWFFSYQLSWLPAIGRESMRNAVDPITNLYLIDTLLQGRFDQFGEVVQHLILPASVLATIPMAIIARMTRSSMLEILRSDYIRTAKAKGAHMVLVVYKHAFKNALIPTITIVGMQMGLLMGGAILTETIFGWPGVGRYIYEAIGFRDYPVIQSGILIVATIFVLINLGVDLLYGVIDPRIKYE